jgi:hypothetical protein
MMVFCIDYSHRFQAFFLEKALLCFFGLPVLQGSFKTLIALSDILTPMPNQGWLPLKPLLYMR